MLLPPIWRLTRLRVGKFPANHVRLKRHELGRVGEGSLQASPSPAIFDAKIAAFHPAELARAEIQTLQMNPDARGGGVKPADVHLGASSRLTCQ
jgi:hypothetical protein